MPSNGGEVTTDGKPLGIDSDGVSRVAMAVDQLGIEFYDIDTLGSEPVLSSRFDLEGNAKPSSERNSASISFRTPYAVPSINPPKLNLGIMLFLVLYIVFKLNITIAN